MTLTLTVLMAVWTAGHGVDGLTSARLGQNIYTDRPACGIEHFTCCSGKVYYPPHEICCVPQWRMPGQIRRAPSRSSQCCGNTTYDTRSQLCCDGVVRPRSRVTATSCCGTVPYPLSTRTCCGNKLYPKSSSWGMACCGNQMFHHARLICCHGVLHPTARDTACCYRAAYDVRRHICCRGRLHSKRTPREGCCGRELCRRY